MAAHLQVRLRIRLGSSFVAVLAVVDFVAAGSDDFGSAAVDYAGSAVAAAASVSVSLENPGTCPTLLSHR